MAGLLRAVEPEHRAQRIGALAAAALEQRQVVDEQVRQPRPRLEAVDRRRERHRRPGHAVDARHRQRVDQQILRIGKLRLQHQRHVAVAAQRAHRQVLQVLAERRRRRFDQRQVDLAARVGDGAAVLLGLGQQPPFAAHDVVAGGAEPARGHGFVHRRERALAAAAAALDTEHVADLEVARPHAVTDQVELGHAGLHVDAVEHLFAQVHRRHAEQRQRRRLDRAFEARKHAREEEMQEHRLAGQLRHHLAQPAELDEAEFLRQRRVFLQHPKTGVAARGHRQHRLVGIEADMPDLGRVQPRHRVAAGRVGRHRHADAACRHQLHQLAAERVALRQEQAQPVDRQLRQHRVAGHAEFDAQARRRPVDGSRHQPRFGPRREVLRIADVERPQRGRGGGLELAAHVGIAAQRANDDGAARHHHAAGQVGLRGVGAQLEHRRRRRGRRP